MALTSDQLVELTAYQGVVTYLVGILDGESRICSDQRLVSTDNIDGMNTTIENTLVAINAIIAPVAP